MFAEHTNKPALQVVKTYLRLKDKKSFPVMLRQPIILSDLKDIILKKTKIPDDDLIVMLHGKVVSFKNKLDPIDLKDKSILHIINKKYLRNDILELLIRLVLRNDQKSCLGETKLMAKSDQSIEQFIDKQILPVIEEKTSQKLHSDSINLVSNGTVLKKQLKFCNYLIENGAQIICMINFVEDLQKSLKFMSTNELQNSPKQSPLYRSWTHSVFSQTEKQKKLLQSKLNKQIKPKQYEQSKEKKQLKESKEQDEQKKIQLQRKQNISPKYFEQKQNKQKYSPTLFPQFADLLNKDISDGWQNNIQSPITIQYPSIQKEEKQNIEQSDQNIEQKQQVSEKQFVLEEPQKKLEKHEQPTKQQPVESQKQKQSGFIQEPEKQEGQQTVGKVNLGDFLLMGRKQKYPVKKTKQEFLQEMSQKFNSFFDKKYKGQKLQQAVLEFPSFQKTNQIKLGEFIMRRQNKENQSKIINSTLINKFNDLLQQKMQKFQKDYDLEQRMYKRNALKQSENVKQIH